MRTHSRSGFTIIELLVVISIIAVLMAVLLPALSGARASARNVQCKSQQRQMGLTQADNVATFGTLIMFYDTPPSTASPYSGFLSWQYQMANEYVGYLPKTAAGYNAAAGAGVGGNDYRRFINGGGTAQAIVESGVMICPDGPVTTTEGGAAPDGIYRLTIAPSGYLQPDQSLGVGANPLNPRPLRQNVVPTKLALHADGNANALRGPGAYSSDNHRPPLFRHGGIADFDSTSDALTAAARGTGTANIAFMDGSVRDFKVSVYQAAETSGDIDWQVTATN